MVQALRGRRSTNVEDVRTGPLMEAFNRLTAGPQSAFYALRTHPFQTKEQWLSQQSMPEPSPEEGAYSPMAFSMGVGQVQGSGARPIDYHPEGMVSQHGALWKTLFGD